MPIVAGQMSKFACLKIDDDSESSDDGAKKATASKKKPSKSAKPKGGGKVSGNGAAPLIVSTVAPKPKRNRKKAKKAQKENSNGVEQSSGAFHAPDDPDELKFREDIVEAIALSTSEAMQPDGGAPKVVDPPEIERLDKLAKELTTNGYNKEVTRTVVEVYRAELIRALQQIQTLTVEVSCATNNVAKYKERYKKLCELLSEAELYDKAKLLTQLERSKALEKELGEEVGALRGELMKASTRINELEERKGHPKH